VNEIEDAYCDLAIETIDQMLDTTAKIHDRRIELLYAMGEELQKRGQEGMNAINRLAESSDERVRYCICGILKSIDFDRTLTILQGIADSPGSYVATRAASTIETLKILESQKG
jgi:maleate cis-trans isomerase